MAKWLKVKQKGPPVISPCKLVEMGIFPNLQMHFTKGPFLDTREYLQTGLFNLEKEMDFIHLPNYCYLLPLQEVLYNPKNSLGALQISRRIDGPKIPSAKYCGDS